MYLIKLMGIILLISTYVCGGGETCVYPDGKIILLDLFNELNDMSKTIPREQYT